MKNQCSRVWPFFLVISALSFILPQAVGAFSASYDYSSAQGRATEERYAFIHHMVGNTYSYRLVDWITDLMHIQEDGFDAVALNLGPDCWQSASVALAYKAASQLGNKVQLFLSLDMTSWPQSGDADAAKLAALVNNYVNHPAQFKYRGKAFISTFAGDQYPGSFGRATVCEGWDYFRSLLTTANTTGTFFIPAFFPSDIKSVLSCVDGLYHWNSAWSLTADPVSDATDKDWISKLGPEKSYMSNVSPALFTNYGASSLNKQILYNTGNNYAQRWAQVSAISSIKFVQVSTYNDFGESSYIGARPHSTQLQPATTTWVNAANHLPWERITKPYIEVYKTGKLTLQRSDLIIWEYRLHPKSAVAAMDMVGRPPNADWLSDEVYVTAYLSQDAEVRVGMGRNLSTVLIFAGKPGMNHFVAPFPASPDGPVVIRMYRNGTNVGGLQQSEVEITSQPATYDFNPIVDQFFHDPDWEACLQ